jgi:hypothetical protein
MTDERKDPPIQPLDYLGGVKVVDIGDIRVARGMSRRPASSCPHRQLHYDTHERRVWCADCERDIEGYDAFVLLTERFHAAQARLSEREKRIREAEAHAVVSLAAKEVDKVWRGRNMVPVCPVCGSGLFPEDFKHGTGAAVGRDYGAAARQKMGKPVPA